MPRKSRRRKDKRALSSRSQGVPAPPKTVVAPANVLKPAVKMSATPYPYVNRELRTVALLAGIILVILIVVALISR